MAERLNALHEAGHVVAAHFLGAPYDVADARASGAVPGRWPQILDGAPAAVALQVLLAGPLTRPLLTVRVDSPESLCDGDAAHAADLAERASHELGYERPVDAVLLAMHRTAVLLGQHRKAIWSIAGLLERDRHLPPHAVSELLGDPS